MPIKHALAPISHGNAPPPCKASFHPRKVDWHRAPPAIGRANLPVCHRISSVQADFSTLNRLESAGTALHWLEIRNPRAEIRTAFVAATLLSAADSSLQNPERRALLGSKRNQAEDF